MTKLEELGFALNRMLPSEKKKLEKQVARADPMVIAARKVAYKQFCEKAGAIANQINKLLDENELTIGADYDGRMELTGYNKELETFFSIEL